MGQILQKFLPRVISPGRRKRTIENEPPFKTYPGYSSVLRSSQRLESLFYRTFFTNTVTDEALGTGRPCYTYTT